MEKGVPFQMIKLESPSVTQGCSVPILVKIGQVVLEKIKIWKVNRRSDEQIDDEQQAHELRRVNEYEFAFI